MTKRKEALEALDTMKLWVGTCDYTPKQLGEMLWKHQETLREALTERVEIGKDIREDFEKHLLKLEPNANIERTGERYVSKFTDFDWQMWQAAKMTEPAWQPIDTAPKDGTRIQLFTVDRQYVGAFNPHSELWMIASEVYVCPTRWMPLPAPPQKQEL